MRVELHDPELSAAIRVYLYTDGPSLATLFKSMAKDWKGWAGTKDWGSLEEELLISCKCDHLGHVGMTVTFKKYDGPEPWKMTSQINLESGQLNQLAVTASNYFEKR